MAVDQEKRQTMGIKNGKNTGTKSASVCVAGLSTSKWRRVLQGRDPDPRPHLLLPRTIYSDPGFLLFHRYIASRRERQASINFSSPGTEHGMDNAPRGGARPLSPGANAPAPSPPARPPAASAAPASSGDLVVRVHVAPPHSKIIGPRVDLAPACLKSGRLRSVREVLCLQTQFMANGLSPTWLPELSRCAESP